MKQLNSLESRIIEISKKHGLSHNGGNLTSVNIIDEIYSIKKEDEPFVISCGHNSLALFVILEKVYGFDAEKLYLKHGTHPNRDLEDKIYCSTGSLGWGISVACGMALADRTKNVYCLISDGEMFEGIIYEVSTIVKKYNVTNLIIYLNFNGWGAYDIINQMSVDVVKNMLPDLKVIKTSVKDYGFEANEAHYKKL